jgi:hypothetical protein
MEKQVIFRDRQEIGPNDFGDMQKFIADSLDHVVTDGLSSGRHFTGLGVTQQSSTLVRCAIGRLYDAGKVYVLESANDISLTTFLPLAAKKIVTIVAFGSVVDTDVEPRDFLIDVDTNTTEPNAVAMQRLRALNVSALAGAESATPVPPAVAATYLAIAHVTLGTTGIESIEQLVGNVLPSAAANRQKITDLELWRGRSEPTIASLTSNIAALAEKTANKADLPGFIRLSADVARLREALNLPAGYESYRADYFGNTAQTDTVLTGATAIVNNGVLFPHAASVQAALALQNPIDPNVTRAGDWLMPKYDSRLMLKTEGFSGDVSLSTYQVQTHSIKSYVTYEYVYNYGWTYNYWWNPWYYSYYYQYYGYDYWWYTASYQSYGYYTQYPVTHYYQDTVTTNYNGVIVAQTFVSPADKWFTGTGIYLTEKSNAGDLHVLLCETEHGKPVLSRVLSRITVPVADLKGNREETRVSMPPVLIESGKRYALALITTGGHKAAVVSGNNFTQGTFFYGNDGEYFVGDVTKDLEFAIYGAEFRQARTEIMLGAVTLAGGIGDLAIKTQQVVPNGTDLVYEIQVAGLWYPISTALGRLSTLPDIVPLRVVMVGTKDLAPGLLLGANKITASRPNLAFIHFSTMNTLGSASSDIRVIVRLPGFEPANHTLTARLVKPDNSEVTAALVETVDNGDGSYTKTFTFNPSPALTQFRIKLSGNRSSAAVKPFTVAESVWVAL